MAADWLLIDGSSVMFRAFFGGIPEARLLFDTRQMRKDAEAFDYSTIGPDVLSVSWAPSYCTPRP